MKPVEQYLETHAAQFEDDLCDLLRIASVSADSQYRAEVRRASEWVADQFRGLKFATEIYPTAGHPIVFARSPEVPGAPTVLVYGHYDVQPPDPLDEWISPPFEPTRRDGNLYARGATDDKGQMLTHVKSAEAWVRAAGGLPLNVKFLIEGEEEIGSAHLDAFIAAHKDLLAADVVVVSDTAQYGPGRPAITYGLRGIMYYQLRLTGPKQDLHSGTFGGAITNPATTLARLLAKIVDDQGRIQIPGYYNDVATLDAVEQKYYADLQFDDPAFMQSVGVDGMWGERDRSTLERRWSRPTFDVNGIWGGYQGEGAKTVLPAKAGAKFSFRLVPNQDPAKIDRALRAMLEAACPPGIRMELSSDHAARGIVVPLDSPYMAAAARAVERGFGRKPVYIREGGSIPVVAVFRELLGIDTLLLGWGLNDDNTHSPNEKFCLADFHRGIKSSAALWDELSRLKK